MQVHVVCVNDLTVRAINLTRTLLLSTVHKVWPKPAYTLLRSVTPAAPSYTLPTNRLTPRRHSRRHQANITLPGRRHQHSRQNSHKFTRLLWPASNTSHLITDITISSVHYYSMNWGWAEGAITKLRTYVSPQDPRCYIPSIFLHFIPFLPNLRHNALSFTSSRTKLRGGTHFCSSTALSPQNTTITHLSVHLWLCGSVPTTI